MLPVRFPLGRFIWACQKIPQRGWFNQSLATSCFAGACLGVYCPSIILALFGGVVGILIVIALSIIWEMQKMCNATDTMVLGMHMIVVSRLGGKLEHYKFEDEELAVDAYNRLGPVARIRFDSAHQEVESWGAPLPLHRIRAVMYNRVRSKGSLATALQQRKHLVLKWKWGGGLECFAFATEHEAKQTYKSFFLVAKVQIDPNGEQVRSWGAPLALDKLRDEFHRQRHEPVGRCS